MIKNTFLNRRIIYSRYNIRYTYFSRNPRITEFLKAYNFVKEYGEGVNRMCNELESAGLNVPEYYCNAFILHTIVYNKYHENSTIQVGNPTIQMEKLTIQTLSQAISKKKYIERTKESIDFCMKEKYSFSEIAEELTMNIAVFASYSGSDLQAIIDGCCER